MNKAMSKALNQSFSKSRFLGVLFIGALVSTSSRAGTPDEEHMADLAKLTFRAAHVPSVDEFRLGNVWDCSNFNSLRGVIPRSTRLYRHFVFTLRDQKLRNDGMGKFRELALQGEWTSQGPAADPAFAGQDQVYFRMTNNGSLIVEHTILFKQDRMNRVSAHRSIANPTRRVYSYYYCKTY